MVPAPRPSRLLRSRHGITQLLRIKCLELQNMKLQYYGRLYMQQQNPHWQNEVFEEEEAEHPEQHETKTIQPRRWYVRPWVHRRNQFGQYATFMPECRHSDPQYFRYFVRMEPALFDFILTRIEHRIKKQDSNFKKTLDPGLKLAVTLRFLATGEAYKSLATAFRIGRNTICLFVPEVCEAIIDELMEETIVCPTDPAGWKEVADGFWRKWQFHHTIGAIDGKHIRIVKPPHSGSVYYNYKGYFSIILLAIVDADAKFIYVDVGANGSASDGGVFKDTPLREMMDEGTAGLPEDEPLPGEERKSLFHSGRRCFSHKEVVAETTPRTDIE